MDHVTMSARLSLSSVLCAYPNQQFHTEVSERIGEIEREGAAPADALCSGIRESLGSVGAAGVDSLRSRYIDLFERGGGPPLVESDLDSDRRLRKTRILADVAGFYLAFGVTGQDSAMEAPDHLAVELEFCAWLVLKEAHLEHIGDRGGARIVRDARCRFLADHLGILAPAVAQHPAVQIDPFYGKAFAWMATLVAEQCQVFGITPELVACTGGMRSGDSFEEGCAEFCPAAACPADTVR